MKIATKLGIVLLMLGLLFAAFVLPKFVQRAEPPMPEEDLAAALAAVEVSEEPETLSEPDKGAKARKNDPELADFYQKLENGDFEAASAEIVRLSEEKNAETIAGLTEDLESGVALLAAEPEIAPAPSDSPEAEFAVLEPITAETAIAPPSEVSVTTLEESNSVEPRIEPSSVAAFFGLVQSGDFETAKLELERLSDSGDEATLRSMRTALANAEKREAERQESQTLLLESQKAMAEMQKQTADQLRSSIEKLAEATAAAQAASKESNELKAELADTKTPATPTEKPAAPVEPISLPETVSISFGFDSSYLTEANQGLLDEKVVSAAESEPRLRLQLRGYADASGPSDYNGILAQARCEMVKDHLLEAGIKGDRISIVSFGESQAEASGLSEAELRRVDVLFRGQ